MWLANKKRTKPLTTIVLHATAGGTLSGAVATLIQRGLSYHYIIDKDGTVYKGVSDERVAFHAGVSEGPDGKGVNAYSIGISFVNKNDGKDLYTEKQLFSAKNIIVSLKKKYSTIRWITTHAIISPRRKTDPKNFVLNAFAWLVGLEIWHDGTSKRD